MESSTKKALLIGGGIVGGLFVVSMIARNAAANAVANADLGTQLIGGGGPVATFGTSGDATAAQDSLSGELGQIIEGQIQQTLAQASVAKSAVGITSASDMLQTAMGQLKNIKGLQFDFTYNDAGQVTGVKSTKALAPMTAAQAAKDTAKANATSQKEILASIKRGFTGAGSTLATAFRSIYDAKGLAAANKAAKDAVKGANAAGVSVEQWIQQMYQAMPVGQAIPIDSPPVVASAGVGA